MFDTHDSFHLFYCCTTNTMYFNTHLIVFVTAIISINSVRIPFIQNATLIPLSASNSSVFYNYTSDECLCEGVFSYSALNYFENNTCQLFPNVPRAYRIQPTPAARLYFPQQILPNASICCMPDLDVLLNKLRTAALIYIKVPEARCLTMDNLGRIVAIEQNPPYIVHFNATDLTLISQTSIPNAAQVWGLTYINEAYYITTDSNNVLVLDSNNLTLINTITWPDISNPPDILFLDNGQTMVIASFGNNKLIFFRQSTSVPTNYSFAYEQSVISITSPHGFWRVNDTFFYVTAWYDNKVSSFRADSSNSTSWTETLAINSQPIGPTSGGSHIAIDECERRWFVLQSYGIQIYDIDGNLIGNITVPNSSYFAVLITEDYVIYLSDNTNGQIIKIDPGVQC